MNFHYSTYTCNTTHRPTNYRSAHFSVSNSILIKPSFNEDAHCDNEVNLILDSKHNHRLIEQSKGKACCNEQASSIGNQTHQYYFMPIREQNSTAILPGNDVTDSASLLLSSADLQHPSTFNLFEESLSGYFSSSTLGMNSSDTTTVNQSNNHNNNNNNANLTDADLAALFLSSIAAATSPSMSEALVDGISSQSHEASNHALDDVFLSQLTDLTCCSPSSSSSSTMLDKPQPTPQAIGPPPGFENFLLESPSTSDLLLAQTTNHNSTASSIDHAGMQTPVSSSDTINFSQLFASAAVDAQQQQQQQQQQQPIVNNSGTVRLSSSSHSSFASDEQSIFFPMSTHHPYSSSSSSSSALHANSQMFSTNTSSSAATTIHSAAKPQIPNSLSLNNSNNNSHFSSSSSASLLTSSTRDSPITITTIENDKRISDGGMTSSHVFAPSNSFFGNGHQEFAPLKPTPKKAASSNHSSLLATRTSTSSASSSTSSSIDDALIQLSQQQQQPSNVNKLFTDEPLSIFHASASAQAKPNSDEEQQAMHDNISFLASLAAVSSPVASEPPWQQTTTTTTTSTSLDSSVNLQRKMRPTMLQSQHSHLGVAQVSSRSSSTNIQELMHNLNELCYKGFDELNALIQEQRWVQNYVNVNSPSPNSPSANLNGSNCCSSRVLIVPEYFIFKCKKVELTATHVFELLAMGRAELRLRDLLFVFKSWKELIVNAELVHQEEENKLRLSTEHPQSYYMTDAVLQAAFDRVAFSIRQLCNLTQQARAAFQYATLNIFQSLSRQQQMQSQNSSTSINLAQLHALQQQASSVLHRPTGSIRTTP